MRVPLIGIGSSVIVAEERGAKFCAVGTLSENLHVRNFHLEMQNYLKFKLRF